MITDRLYDLADRDGIEVIFGDKQIIYNLLSFEIIM